MKLTNTLRDAFVRAAMDDVPSVDYDEKIRSLITKDAIKQLPPKIRALYNDTDTRHYVNTHNRSHFGLYINFPCGSDGYKPSDETKAEAEKLQSSGNVQSERDRTLRNILHAVAYSVRTRKALVDALPEFEKYLPDDEAAACRTLPAIANVVSEFVKAGWSKDVKKVKGVK